MTAHHIKKPLVLSQLISNLQSICPNQSWSGTSFLVRSYESQMDNPLRIYHDWEHVASMLELVQEIPEKEIGNLEQLQAAILFYCSDYIPGRDRNEQFSTVFAGRFYPEKNFSEIAMLIRSTRLVFPFDYLEGDCAIMRDLTLMNLCSSSEIFKTNAIRVMREFVNAKVFTNEEAFDHMLTFSARLFTEAKDRSGIFKTPYFNRNFEQIAQDNLLKILSTGL